MWISQAYTSASLFFLSSFVVAAQVNELTDTNFQSHLKANGRLAIVDFFAPWCHHCQQFAPVFETAAQQANQQNLKVFFAKVNCDKDGKKICKKFNIQFLPTIKIFNEGNPILDYEDKRQEGAILAYLRKVLATPLSQLRTPGNGVLSDATGYNHKIPANVTPWHPGMKRKTTD